MQLFRKDSSSVTWVLIILNLAVFVWELFNASQVESILYHFGVVPSNWSLNSFEDFIILPGQCIALISSQFLHGSILHLSANLIYLLLFGSNLEPRIGHRSFLIIYLSSGIASGIVHVLLMSNSEIPMVGASGAIAGVLGAFVLSSPPSCLNVNIGFNISNRTFQIPAIVLIVFWCIVQWGYGVTTIGAVVDVGGIAFWAHLGGFTSGMAALVAISPRRLRNSLHK